MSKRRLVIARPRMLRIRHTETSRSFERSPGSLCPCRDGQIESEQIRHAQSEKPPEERSDLSNTENHLHWANRSDFIHLSPRHRRARPGDPDCFRRRASLIGMAGTDPRIKSGDGHDGKEHASQALILRRSRRDRLEGSGRLQCSLEPPSRRRFAAPQDEVGVSFSLHTIPPSSADTACSSLPPAMRFCSSSIWICDFS
jgi:hypothetical protein